MQPGLLVVTEQPALLQAPEQRPGRPAPHGLRLPAPPAGGDREADPLLGEQHERQDVEVIVIELLTRLEASEPRTSAPLAPAVGVGPQRADHHLDVWVHARLPIVGAS